MRFPVEPLTPTEPGKVADIYELREIAALAAVKRVVERTLPPLVSHPKRVTGEAASVAETPAAVAESEHDERRQADERRTFCRRVDHQPDALFDTRSEVDRRKGSRRIDERANHIDEEV